MQLSDVIAQFINEMLEDEKEAVIKRNYLAEQLGCVPSQINYVIQTRFTPMQGYYVESQRGGGGYIKITKLEFNDKEYIMHTVNSIGNKVSDKEAKVFIDNFIKNDIITEKEARLFKSATNDNVLKIPSDIKDNIRANILKNMLISLL